MKRAFLLLVLFIVGCTSPNPFTPMPGSTASVSAPAGTVSPGTDTSVPRTETPALTDTPPVTDTSLPTDTPTAAVGSVFPDPDNYQWLEVTPGVNRPVDIQHAGDGSGRLFIIEQPGRIRVIQDGQLIEAPFLDITDRVNSSANERGLLGLAFHPQYEQNGYFYVNYTGAGGDTFISRFQVTGDPNVADPASEKQLLTVDQPYPNHNGGATAFGPDGYLYLGLGDGGSGGDPLGNGQNTETLLGKILRIDVNNGDPYSIPANNPFGNEIWAYGLRNPWRMSFDRATGDLWIGDVGQGAWEEIDYLAADSPGGANFGWSLMEGNHPYNGQPGPDLIPPVAEYSHDFGCSVTGGYVYRGESLPEWQGIYIYADYCTGFVWGVIPAEGGWQQSEVLFETGGLITSFGEDEGGELYMAGQNGRIYKLVQK